MRSLRSRRAPGVNVERPAVVARDPDLVADERLRGRRSKQDQDLGLDEGQFGLDPAAGRRRSPVRVGRSCSRLLPPGAGRHLKCFDDVGDEDGLTVDAGCLRAPRRGYRPAGPTNGAPSRSSLSPGLFADEHPASRRGTLTEHRLRRAEPTDRRRDSRQPRERRPADRSGPSTTVARTASGRTSAALVEASDGAFDGAFVTSRWCAEHPCVRTNMTSKGLAGTSAGLHDHEPHQDEQSRARRHPRSSPAGASRGRRRAPPRRSAAVRPCRRGGRGAA